MRVILAGLTAAILVVGTGAAVAALDADSAIKYRIVVMKGVASHFNAMFAAVKNNDTLGADLVPHAEAFVANSKMPWKAFGPGTDKGTEPHHAAPAVWTDAAGFKALATKFEAAAAEVLVAAKSGDLAQTQAKLGATGAICKDCHEKYRVK